MKDEPPLERSNLLKAGYTRTVRGKKFRYANTKKRPITNSSVIRRIEKLAIPPAWTEVWISPSSRAHIQAHGNDAQGDRQYIYHRRWVTQASKQKYQRMLDLVKSIKRIRISVGRSLNSSDKPNELRAHALAVALIDSYGLRVGGASYLKRSGSRGVTTLQVSNVQTTRTGCVLKFRGKSGQLWQVEISDPVHISALNDFIRGRRRGRLLRWQNQPKQKWRSVTEQSLNTYIQQLAEAEITAKDFRTLKATALAAYELGRLPLPQNAHKKMHAVRKKIERQVVTHVAAELHNTPAVVRNSYIDPRIFALFHNGLLPKFTSLTTSEAALPDLFRQAERLSLE